jgi:hypothetical protein
MSAGPVARGLILAAGSLLVLLSVMSVRAYLEARAHRAQARVFMAEADADSAIIELRQAARWAAPLNFAMDAALDDLLRMGQLARERGERSRALAAFRAVHAAIHASRSLWLPNRSRLDQADRAIAMLMAEESSSAGTVDPALVDAHVRALNVERPRPWWTLTAVLGFAAWVLGAVIFMTRGLDARGRLVRKVAKRSVLAVLVGWVAFVLGLRFT